jgi:hypothetical protein
MRRRLGMGTETGMQVVTGCEDTDEDRNMRMTTGTRTGGTESDRGGDEENGVTEMGMGRDDDGRDVRMRRRGYGWMIEMGHGRTTEMRHAEGRWE